MSDAAPAPAPHEPAMTKLSVSRGLMDATAQTLEALSREVETLGVDLCVDPDIAGRFLDQLQGIDRIAQSLDQLASVLRAPLPEAAIDQVRMGDLQARLRIAHGA